MAIPDLSSPAATVCTQSDLTHSSNCSVHFNYSPCFNRFALFNYFPRFNRLALFNCTLLRFSLWMIGISALFLVSACNSTDIETKTEVSGQAAATQTQKEIKAPSKTKPQSKTKSQQSSESQSANQLFQMSSPNQPEGLEYSRPELKSSIPQLLEKVQSIEEETSQNQAATNQEFTPYKGSKARIYGSYNLGCIDGAVVVSDKEQTFQLQRWGVTRNYVHPMMADYIFDLVKRAKKAGLPPLIFGDMSRPYGGPIGPGSTHASHETGLDLDIPFDFALPRKSAYELQHPEDVYIVKGRKIQKAFTPTVATLIKTAATDPRVERIFVAPMIKKQMCLLYEGKGQKGDDMFLQRLRPWFGHQAHMHVRLKCPSDSPECINQKPAPTGTGCGDELTSWFLPPPPKDPNAKPAPKKKKVKPELPLKCQILLQEHPNID